MIYVIAVENKHNCTYHDKSEMTRLVKHYVFVIISKFYRKVQNQQSISSSVYFLTSVASLWLSALSPLVPKSISFD